MIDEAMIREFVRESNAIENIYAESGDPLYDDHLQVAIDLASTPQMFASSPRAIHDALMASEEHKFPGQYRQLRVAVGGEEKMQPVFVRSAMAALLSRCPHEATTDEACWELHYEFERIHPFVDGNGRTGRLWMNALRQLAGLPWVIVRADERWDYYERIRSYERAVPEGTT